MAIRQRKEASTFQLPKGTIHNLSILQTRIIDSGYQVSKNELVEEAIEDLIKSKKYKHLFNVEIK